MGTHKTKAYLTRGTNWRPDGVKGGKVGNKAKKQNPKQTQERKS
jgi:hypothetical protein